MCECVYICTYVRMYACRHVALHLRASVFYVSYCPSVHVLASIASLANALCIIKLLYNSTVSMVMDAICTYKTV